VNANDLLGVSADSRSDAWAVGTYGTTAARHTLILHWNGTTWARVPSPNPGTGLNGGSVLTGVSADSVSDAWAVGYYFNNTTGVAETLILHWNGTTWARVPSPSPGPDGGGGNFLLGVSADSGSDAWAVGDYDTTTGAAARLILHWNGTAWSTT
jgi:hypothetical protein